MANKESLFAGLHILMPAISDGPADAGRRLHRYWYRESRCQIRIGWQKQNQCNLRNLRLKNSSLCALRGEKTSVNPVILSISSSCPSCASWLKNPFNQRNPRLINNLRACNALYNCRDTFTDVMIALQINLFMQNEPKFRKSQMNVNKVLTNAYEKRTLGERGKNKPNTNPIKANFKKAEINVTSYITKGYENKPPNRAPKKRTQFPLTKKNNANLFTTKDYEKNRAFGPRQFKPNQTQYKANTRTERRQTPVKYPDDYRGVFFNRGFCLYTATLLKAQETHLSLYQS